MEPPKCERRHLQMGFSTPIPTWKLLGEICRPFFLKTWSQPLARVTSTSAQALERVGFFGVRDAVIKRDNETSPYLTCKSSIWANAIPSFHITLGNFFGLVVQTSVAIWMTGGKLSKRACCRPRPDTSGNTVQPHKAQNHPREEESKLMGTSPFWMGMDGMDTVNGGLRVHLPNHNWTQMQITRNNHWIGLV